MSPNIPVETPIRVALVNSVEPVHRLVADMLEPFAPRFRLLPPDDPVADIALVDVQIGEDALQRVRALVEDATVAHVALFATTTSSFLVDAALAIGACGVVIKGGEPAALATALEQISIGRPVGLDRHAADATVLTEREHEVLRLLGHGLSNRAIGGELYVGVETVRTHVRQILRKLGVANRTQAALRAGDISLDDLPPRAAP